MPEWHEWKDRCQVEKRELIGLVKKGHAWEINDKLYKEMKSVYYDTFNGKCGYCEKKIEKPYESELDHFRPKKRVTYLDDTLVMIETSDGTREHPGYYWLAYDWDNLILSCTRCNKPNNDENAKLGKRNRFPVKDDIYATIPGDEISEEPLLINPLTEDPQDCLEYDSSSGFIKGSGKGTICVEVFGLNIRDDLVEGRKNAYDKVLTLLTKCLYNKHDRHETLEELKKIQDGKQAHSLAAFAALKDANDIWSVLEK